MWGEFRRARASKFSVGIFAKKSSDFVQERQPKIYNFLFLIIGIILISTKNILFGIGVIMLGLSLGVFWGGKRKRYLLNSSAINSASQKTGSHKLMKIIANEMSKGSSMEVIIEALEKEIEDTINAVKNR